MIESQNVMRGSHRPADFWPVEACANEWGISLDDLDKLIEMGAVRCVERNGVRVVPYLGAGGVHNGLAPHAEVLRRLRREANAPKFRSRLAEHRTYYTDAQAAAMINDRNPLPYPRIDAATIESVKGDIPGLVREVDGTEFFESIAFCRWLSHGGLKRLGDLQRQRDSEHEEAEYQQSRADQIAAETREQIIAETVAAERERYSREYHRATGRWPYEPYPDAPCGEQAQEEG